MSFKNILTIKQIIQSENNFFEKKPSKDLMRIAVEKLFNEISKEKLKKKILIISGQVIMVMTDPIFLIYVEKILNKSS